MVCCAVHSSLDTNVENGHALICFKRKGLSDITLLKGWCKTKTDPAHFNLPGNHINFWVIWANWVCCVMLAGCPWNTSSRNAHNFHPLRNQRASTEQGYDTECRAAIGESTAVVTEIDFWGTESAARFERLKLDSEEGLWFFPVSKGSNRGFGCSFALTWRNGVRSLLGRSLNCKKVCEGQENAYS